MITIRSGKLTIPEDERFVGFAGDTPSEEKTFIMYHYFVPNSVFTLNLRFDDGSVSSIVLPSYNADSNSILTWNIRSEHLKRKGIVTAQLKIVGRNGSVTHTTRDYFIVGSSAEIDDDVPSGDYVTLSQMEESIDAVEAQLPYAVNGGVYLPDEGNDIRLALHGEVYSKSEIDGILGDLEDQLSQI